MPYHTMPYHHITSYHVTWYNIISFHIVWYHSMENISYHVIWYCMMRIHVLWYHMILCFMWYYTIVLSWSSFNYHHPGPQCMLKESSDLQSEAPSLVDLVDLLRNNRRLVFALSRELLIGKVVSGTYQVSDNVPLSTNDLVHIIGQSLGKKARNLIFYDQKSFTFIAF